MKNKNGFSAIIVLVIGLIGFLAVSAYAYYYLKSSGRLPQIGVPKTQNTFNSYTPLPVFTPSPTQTPDSMDTIQTELDTIIEGSVDTDIKELESSASSL